MGAMLAGSKEFIRKALFERKRLGGGMRQVGIVAAAGHYALDRWEEQMKVDHANMAYIASNIEKCGGGGKIKILSEKVPTNIIYFQLMESAPISA